MVAAPSFLIHSRLSPWMMVRSWVRGLANRLEAEAQNDQMMKGRWLGWNGGGRPSWPRLNPHTVGIEWPWKTQRLWLAASHRWDPSEAACRAGATTDESSEPSLTRVGYDTSFFLIKRKGGWSGRGRTKSKSAQGFGPSRVDCFDRCNKPIDWVDRLLGQSADKETDPTGLDHKTLICLLSSYLFYTMAILVVQYTPVVNVTAPC
jgi:hypothetical protein